jgi:cysteine-rich repeat protein
MIKKTITIIFCILIILNISSAEEITTFSNGLNSVIFPFDELLSDSIQIEITENGMCVDTARISITGEYILSTQQGAADVILITDRSGSMGWNFTDEWSDDGSVFRNCDDPNINLPSTTRISVAKCIDKKFVNDFLDSSNPSLRIALVSYSTTSTIDQTFTNNEQILIDEINSYVDTSSTCISCAIDDAINEVINNGNDNSPKSIILMTDGKTNYCIGYNCGEATAIAEAEDLSCNYDNPESAAELGITIYTVAFGDGSEVNEELLQDIADCTGGQFFKSDDPETLFDIYEQIAQDIMTNSYPTPSIDINNDGTINFDVSDTLDGTIIWNDNSCTGASCDSLIYELNLSTTACSSPPCSIDLLVSTSTPGNITLHNLYISTSECEIPTFCGDHEIQYPNDNNEYEECDNGSLNNDFQPDACRTNCLNASCGDNIIDSLEECDDGNNDDGDDCSAICMNETVCLTEGQIEMIDRTVEFNYTSFPGHDYNLEEMVFDFFALQCEEDSLTYSIDSSSNFLISQTDSDITIVPNDPDWTTATSETLNIETSCIGPACYKLKTETEIKLGNADIVLITDFSGSMKKAIDSWTQGTGDSNCETLYLNSDARKTHLARCVDKELVTSVLNYSGNRIWPVFIHDDEIKSYVGNPENEIDINNYIDNSGPQGKDKTCLSCAINEAYEIFANNNDPNRHRFIIFMTDGVPTHCSDGSCESISSTYGTEVCEGFCDTNGQDGCGSVAQGCDDNLCEPTENNTLFSANRVINDFNTRFYTIGFGLIQECSRAKTLLTHIAEVTGGTYYHSSNTLAIRQIYQDIAQEIVDISKIKEWIEEPTIQYTGSSELNIIYDNYTECGNHIVEYNEECDDGNSNNFDSCDNNCHAILCNNFNVEGIEECDDGTDTDLNDECIIDYSKTPAYVCMDALCGDGYRWSNDCIVNINCEDCDNGVLNSNSQSNACREDCTDPICGDHVWDNLFGEDCDDNTPFCNDACEKTCVWININTIKNNDFNSIDLYEINEINNLWTTEEIFTITENKETISNINSIYGPNSVKFEIATNNYLGYENINVTLEDSSGNNASICFNLTVNDIPNYIPTPINQTRLLVAKGNLVTGYGLDPLFGQIETWGPYIITVKVWEKDKRQND